MIDVDTSSSVAEIRVSEAVVNRILLRYVDKKTNEVRCLAGLGACCRSFCCDGEPCPAAIRQTRTPNKVRA